MSGSGITSDTRREQVRATGLVYFKAVVDHAVEHGLPAPATIELTDEAIKVWLVEGKDQWGETITVDEFEVRPSPVDDRVIVYVTGRLPFMSLPIVLAFSREQQFATAIASLHVVGA